MSDDKRSYRKFILDDAEYETLYTEKYDRRKPFQRKDPRLVLAEIPGVIVEVTAKPGRRVKRGDALLKLEAMKMKNDIFSPRDGLIKAVNVVVGDTVPKNHVLVEFE